MASTLQDYAKAAGYVESGGMYYKELPQTSPQWSPVRDNLDKTRGYTQLGMAQMMGMSRSADALAGAPSPGQDIYSKGLERMMTGEFTPNDPSYAWRFQQGQKAVERSAAARGLLGSGNAALELQAYGQGAASTEYQNQFSRLLAASQNAMQQYDTSLSGLARMMGISTEIGALNSQMDQQSYLRRMAGLYEQGIQAGLQTQAPTQETTTSSKAAPEQAPSDTHQTVSYYSPANYWSYYSTYGAVKNSTASSLPSGTGYWSSSSGGSGTIGS